MTSEGVLLLHAAVGAAAYLYAAVGHGGASAYLAVLALLGVARRDASATALLLNLLVAGASFRAFRAQGHFSPRLALPFCLLSVPAAWLSSSWRLGDRAYELLLAAVLSFAALRLWRGGAQDESPRTSPPPPALAAAAGGGIGLLSGMLGIGGGVLLSPLMILRGWADPKSAAAASALFILVNSAAGLLGRWSSGQLGSPAAYAPLALTAFLGGLLGARAGSSRWSGAGLRRALAAVLLAADAKLLAGG